jgi:hypothetical protein
MQSNVRSWPIADARDHRFESVLQKERTAMKRPRIALLVVLLTGAVGCAMDATVRVPIQDMPGRYYSGDGLGRNVYVTLKPDGGFVSDWQGCLGVYGQAEETWRLEGDRVVFEHQAASGELAGYLRRATTVRHDGTVGFARSEDVVKDRVDEALVFLRQED